MMSTSQSLFRYRPDIDGLRALAVLAVVLSHAGIGIPGGFIGVDVFFVISGYLITSLIWREVERGEFRLSAFWERRIRRIAPALVVMTGVTVLAGCALLLPKDLEDLAGAGLSQSAFVANLYYWRSTGYFEGIASEKALLHTWSLAIEEQFYLLLPVALLGVSFSRSWRTPLARVTAFAGGCASLCLCVWALPRYPAATFYLLPTRAWELLLGTGVALLPSVPGSPRPLREGMSAIGLFGIVAAFLLFDESAPLPGLLTAIPCLGTAFVIAGNTGGAGTLISQLISIRPLVFIGLTSYSLYLWHWPLLSFANYWALRPLPFSTRCLLVVTAVAVGAASWRLIEKPIREKRFLRSPRSLYAFAFTSLVTIATVSSLILYSGGVPHRFSKENLIYANAPRDRGIVAELDAEDVRNDRLVALGDEESVTTPDVLVWGDSYGMAALPAFDEFLKERRAHGVAATRSSTAPVRDFVPTGVSRIEGERMFGFNEAVYNYAISKRVRDVVIVGCWECYASDAAPRTALVQRLTEMIESLSAANIRTWVLLQVPTYEFDVPKALVRAGLTGESLEELTRPPGAPPASSTVISIGVLRAGGRVIDPREAFLNDAKTNFILSAEGRPLYRDSGHLTPFGAKQTLLPLLRTTLGMDDGSTRDPDSP